MNYRFSSKHSFKLQINGWQGILVSYLVFLLISIIFSVVAFSSIAKGDYKPAKTFLMISKPISKVTSIATFGKVPIIEFWSESISLGQDLISLLENDQDLASLLSSEELSGLLNSFSILTDYGNDSLILSAIANKKGINLEDIGDLVKIAKLLEQEKTLGKKYLLLFQNSDEIRATGGFIGSYAVLDFTNEDLLDFQIRDIYDPSGISKRKPSPFGHSQFLSGGEGLALHDANWNPDFSSSAKDILWFFENIESDAQFYDGVIAINFSSIEKIVGWLGEIYLPNEGEFVSADDLSSILRNDRSEFFAGSKQKTQQLSAFQNALMIKINSLSTEEKNAFVKNLLSSKVWQEVQFYSKENQVQSDWRELGLSGDFFVYENESYVFPVESNVGVNKANKWITRYIEIEKNEKLIRLKTTFVNQATINDRPKTKSTNQDYATASHLGYVNYYRFITSTDLKLVSVISGNEVLNEWNQETIIVGDEEYTQYGFLVIVPESSQTEVVLDFSTENDFEIVVQKQAIINYENKKDLIDGRFWIEEVQ